MIKSNRAIHAFESNAAFLLVIIYLLLNNLIRDLWGYNEFTVLVYARHFYDRTWIPHDWFLNLSIPYRYLFNTFAGFIASKLPFYIVEIVGRAIIFTLLAYLIQRYAKTFGLPWYLVICFLAFYLFFPSIVAEEWIIGGFETKPFAYFFLLLALLCLLQKRLFWCFFFSGLAVSFHVLVGFYGSCCIFGTFLLNREYRQTTLTETIRIFPVYILSALPGIYTITSVLLRSKNVDKKLAGLIYVTLRVPHHTLPSFWVKYRGGYSWVFAILSFLCFLIIVFWKCKERKYRIVSGFALCSSVFFFTGLIIFASHKLYLLKYYWFRVPDTIIPFISFFLFFALLGKLTKEEQTVVQDTNSEIFPRLVKKTGIIAAIVLLGFAGLNFYKSYTDARDNIDSFRYDTADRDLRNMMLWIRKNTGKESKFLISPFIRSFYIVAQRAIFVSFKHVPASDSNILEWYRRLLLCNNGKTLKGQGFKGQSDAEFYNLGEGYIRKLAKTYHLDYYLGKPGRNGTFPRVHENHSYVLYRITD